LSSIHLPHHSYGFIQFWPTSKLVLACTLHRLIALIWAPFAGLVTQTTWVSGILMCGLRGREAWANLLVEVIEQMTYWLIRVINTCQSALYVSSNLTPNFLGLAFDNGWTTSWFYLGSHHHMAEDCPWEAQY
jgi:hypothetical protein